MPTLAAVASSPNNFLTSATSGEDIFNLLKTSEQLASRYILVIDGVPKVGKTIAACSASAKWPGQNLGKTDIEIDDVLFCTYENALEGLSTLGLTLKYV